MKIISWNCCLPPWSLTRHHRLPFIVSALLKEKPDIICLQEVFFKADSRYLLKNLEKAGFKYSFRYQDLLTLSKLPLTATYGKKFKEQGKILSFSILDVIYGKAFQTVKVETPAYKIHLAHTHLLSAYALAGKGYQNSRIQQIKELVRHLAKTRAGIILLGDLNFQPGTEPYEVLMAEKYSEYSRSVRKTKANKKLDYVFARNLALDVRGLSSKFNAASDHAYITMELKS